MRKVPLESFDDLSQSLGMKKPKAGRTCDHPICEEAGDHRAPKSPTELNDYYWFCFQHVSEYNKAWNYYKGLTEDEIEKEMERDIMGRRPTWPLGMRVGRMAGRFGTVDDDFDDTTGLFDRDRIERAEALAEKRKARTEEDRALETLQLNAPVDMTTVKARYKALAKKFHPDANDGDEAAEDRLKAINEAYTILKKSQGEPWAR